ncbi:MAG: hypothetical protein U0R70_08840 [Solirubrobacteraceae bacterium]
MPRELTEKQRQALDEGRRKMTPAKRAALELGRAGTGNRRATRHGMNEQVIPATEESAVARAVATELVALIPDLGPIREQILAGLGDAHRDDDGGVAAWAMESIETLLLLKWHVVMGARYLALHGHVDEKGRERPEVEMHGKKIDRYRRALADEAATLRSRVAGGLDLARTVDLASAMSERDPERRARLLEEAGLPAGEEVAGDG